jgi:hypothetical protein
VLNIDTSVRSGTLGPTHRRRTWIWPSLSRIPTRERRKQPKLQQSAVARDLSRVPVLLPNQVISADELGRAMVDVAVRETGKHGGVILENRDIRAMVKWHALP